MKPLLQTIILLCLCSQTLLSQASSVISGVIVDASTEEPIPFANVAISGQVIGTVANAAGEYEFHFPSKFLSDTLVASSIGYHSYEVSIPEIFDRKRCILKLKARAYNLEELVVRPDDVIARDILSSALDKVAENYPQEPYLMEGFYREYFRENGKYVGLAEAAVDILDQSAYMLTEEDSSRIEEKIRIKEIRVSDIYNRGNYVLYIALQDALAGDLLKNYAFWKNFFLKERLTQTSLGEMTFFEDTQVYCINFSYKKGKRQNLKGKAYIRTDDLAIIHLETTNKSFEREKLIGPATPKETTNVLKYKRHNGKYFLNYINSSTTIQPKIEKEDFELIFSAELAVNNLLLEEYPPFEAEDRVLESSIFYLPRYQSYDPAFWEDYQLFETSNNYKHIVDDLESRQTLDEQYKSHGKLKAAPKEDEAIKQVEKSFLLDKVLTQMYESGKFNGSVLVRENEQELVRMHLGDGQFEKKRELSDQTMYHLGDISQQFTAAAIMLLKQEELLEYDDPLKKFFPKLKYKNLTIRHLLNQSSGIADYSTWGISHERDFSNATVMRHLHEERPGLLFVPGRKHEHSNTNYVILASIVETLTEESFLDFIRKRFLVPLGMQHTCHLSEFPDTLSHLKATAYSKGASGNYRPIAQDKPNTYGDAYYYSSLEDLLTWEQSFYSSQILEEGVYIEGFRPAKLVDEEKANIGFAWYLRRDNGRRVQYGRGSRLGHKCLLFRDITEKNTIIILNNTDIPYIREMERVLTDILYADEYKGKRAPGGAKASNSRGAGVHSY